MTAKTSGNQHLLAVFPLRKFYTEQMFVLVRIQLRTQVGAQPVKRFKC